VRLGGGVVLMQAGAAGIYRIPMQFLIKSQKTARLKVDELL